MGAATFDFARGAPADEALVSTPGFDFRGHIVAETDGGAALGVRTTVDAVPVEHGERLSDALTAAGRPPQRVLHRPRATAG